MDKLDRVYQTKLHIEAVLALVDSIGSRCIDEITGDQLSCLLSPIQAQLHQALLEVGYLKA